MVIVGYFEPKIYYVSTQQVYICKDVCPSVIPSIRSCPRNSSYVFHQIDLKFYRLPSCHMKMCIWFLIFVSAIFDEVMALADSYLDLAAPVTSFIELT